MKGVMLDVKSIDSGDINFDSLKSVVSDWQFYDFTAEEEVDDRIKGADIIVTNKVKINKNHLTQASALKLICVAATGTNNVDLKAAESAGIPVANVTNYATPSVVQHVFCLILSLVRKLMEYRQAVQENRWQQSPFFCLLDYPISELSGKTLGIIGYGVLGKAVATVGEAFGMKVVVAAHKGTTATEGRLGFEQVIQDSDVISLHCPLTDETRNLIGSKEFSMMKPAAILINTARGGIVNEDALVNALKTGQIAGAGFDVLSQEPPVDGNVLLDNSLPNLIVTPHIAWASVESRQRAVNEISLNIKAFLEGEHRNRVC
ncbi:2-hydroxyacid dehydrogenase [Kaarinaea lacus]